MERQIQRLERIHGPNHRVVKTARGWVEDLEAAQVEEIREFMQRVADWESEREREAGPSGEPNA